MPVFTDILKQLAPIEDIVRLELQPQHHGPVEVIENRPGQSGSVAVYHTLQQEFGTLTPEAARKGLELYAEHVADATAHPGKHPNIDRLFAVIEHEQTYKINIITKSS